MVREDSDIYRTHMEDGQWTKPENMGAPINSADDDFSLIMDVNTNSGYFASNRAGGKGADDLYRFTVNRAMLDYKVTVRVIDEATTVPLASATLALDCRMPSDENSLTNENGEKEFTVKGGNTCTLNVLKPGYKDGLAEITPSNNGGTIIVPMKAEANRLAVTFKEEKTLMPIKNTVVSLTGAAGSAPVNYVTDDAGLLSAHIAPGSYKISMPDYPAVNEQISTTEADMATGAVTKQILIKRDNMEVNVPLGATGFPFGSYGY